MRLRTQLLLAFLILAVLPLIAIVLYSYATSLRAFRQIVAEEADLLTMEMEGHLKQAQEDLQHRVRRIGRLPEARRFFSLDESSGDDQAFLEMLEGELGDAASFIESFQVIPSTDVKGSGWMVIPPRAPVESVAAPEAVSASAASSAPVAPGIDETSESVPQLQPSLEEEALAARLEDAQSELERELEQLGEELELRMEEEGSLSAVIEVATEMAMIASASALEISAQKIRHIEVRQIDLEHFEALSEERQRILSGELASPVVVDEEELGMIRADIDPEILLGEVLGRTRRDRGEIPFAVDSEGNLFVAKPEDRERLADLPLTGEASSDRKTSENWVVGTRKDPQTGLVFGIARPIRDSVEEIRRTAVRNLGWGLALVGLAVLGILPLSSRMSANLAELTRGAESLAAGNLDTQVEVRSKNEVGQLAAAFNRMAHDLQKQQVRLLAEERRRREEEMDRRLLEAEHARKTRELEDARSFQLSLLPREVPQNPRLDLAVHMSTATEVGGDYYDFRSGEAGELTLAVGDATGHGARAGTMVTVIKSLFSAGRGAAQPAAFLAEANSTIRRMQLGRMAMALAIARIQGSVLRLALAGMPPALIYRHGSREIEEIALAAMPLGSLADVSYDEVDIPLAAGDTLLLMSDGLPELQDAKGEPLGYERVRQLFSDCVAETADETIAALAAEIGQRTAGRAPSDDVTLVAIRVLA